MLKLLYPYEYAESVFSLNFHKLYQLGYRGIIFDIDQTLVAHGKETTAEIDELFRNIHKFGFRTLFLSNNEETRIQSFNKNIETLYINDANKPNPANYLKAVEMMEIKKEQALMVGDQIFTDILGANRSGIASIMVKYIDETHATKVGPRRNLEKIILKFYHLNKASQNRIGNIYKLGEDLQDVVE